MTEKLFNVVDRDYGRCYEISSPRKIRTKSASFGSIRARFNEFRIKLLQKKLDRAQEKSLTDGYSTGSMEKQLEKNALRIAKLEEKIMFLSKENVPQDFVSSRALKLRNNMFHNLTYKCGNYYSIGLEKKDEIFGSVSDEVSSNFANAKVEPSEKTEVLPEIIADVSSDNESAPIVAMVKDDSHEQIDVVPASLERKQIEDAVNSEFASLSDSSVVSAASDNEIEEYNNSSELNALSSSSVRSVIDESFDELESIPEIVGSFEKDEKKESLSDDSTVNNTNVENLNNGVVQNMMPQSSDISEPILISIDNEDVGPAISHEEIKQEINKEINKIKISGNESSAARVSRYDSNGNKLSRRNEYVPMTSEEIKASQEKLGFDEHGHLLPKQEITEAENMVSTASVIGKNVTPFVIPNLSFDAVFVPTQNDDEISDNQLRGDTVLVPDRTDSQSVDATNDLEHVEELAMIREDDNKSEVTSATEYQIKRDEYNSLKEKIASLQQKKDEIRRRKLAAQEAAEDAAARALEAKRMLEESQKKYDENMKRLRDYTAELEEDCNRDLKSVELTENDARISDDFAQMQREKADQNHRIIDEIGSLLGDYGENVSHKSK